VTDQVPLAGKTALVTGGARRIGRAIALALAGEGVHLALHYRESQAEAREAAAEISAVGVACSLLQADLAQADGIEPLWEAAVQALGSIDFLINSASIFPTHTLLALTPENLDENLRVNTLAPFALSRLFHAQQREGAIVNLLDARMVDYDRLHVPYHLSKRMLHDLTRMTAVEFAPLVRVNGVAPGLILPPEGKDDSYLEKLASTNPLLRYGSTDGIAEATLFLLRSGFITGQVLFVDGGRHLYGNMYG
jgi:pteridine reductase